MAEAVASWYQDQGITEFNPNFLADDIARMRRLYGRDKLWVQRIKDYETYLDIGVAYDWSFDITETDNADGSLDFNIPFFHPGSFDLKSSALLHKTRQAKRAFKNGEKFAAL